MCGVTKPSKYRKCLPLQPQILPVGLRWRCHCHTLHAYPQWSLYQVQPGPVGDKKRSIVNLLCSQGIRQWDGNQLCIKESGIYEVCELCSEVTGKQNEPIKQRREWEIRLCKMLAIVCKDIRLGKMLIKVKYLQYHTTQHNTTLRDVWSTCGI